MMMHFVIIPTIIITTIWVTSFLQQQQQQKSSATLRNSLPVIIRQNEQHFSANNSSSTNNNFPTAKQQQKQKDSSSMRICVLVEPCPFTYVCGYTNRYKALLQHLYDNTNDHVEIITSEVVNVHNRPYIWLNKYPIHYTTGMRLPHYPLMTICIDWKFKIYRILRHMKNKNNKQSVDILHVSSPGFLVFAGILWSRILNIPLLFSYHTHLPVYVRSYVKPKPLSIFTERIVWMLIRIVHSFADLTVVTSPQVQEEFQKHGVPRCQVWQKGIDTERFHPKHYNAQMRARMIGRSNVNDESSDLDDDNTFLMVYIGRLGSEKRLQDLRAVLDKMQQHDHESQSTKQTRLCFVGGGPQEDELKILFPDCIFTGLLHGTELCQAFASADVFCMPSDSETLGFVVLESMASGVPVIGVKAGGVQDLIHNGITGYLVEPGNNTDEFVNRLIQLKNNNTLRIEMSKYGRKEMEKWNWNESMKILRNEQYIQTKMNFYYRFEQQIWRILTFEWLQLQRRRPRQQQQKYPQVQL